MIIQNFKYSREELDLKQKDIAEMFGVHFTTVSGWETGKDTIPIERLVDYANRFHYSLDYLFGLTRHNEDDYLPLTLDLDVIAKNLRYIRKKNNYKIPGILLSIYFIWYGIGRFFIEGLRTDSLYIGIFRVSQIVSIILIIIGIIMFIYLLYKNRNKSFTKK